VVAVVAAAVVYTVVRLITRTRGDH